MFAISKPTATTSIAGASFDGIPPAMDAPKADGGDHFKTSVPDSIGMKAVHGMKS